MSHFISEYLIKVIADHHDAYPNSYDEFADTGGFVLATREGGFVRDVRTEILSLERRISDVINTLECTGITEAKLVIGDGTRYVIVYRK